MSIWQTWAFLISDDLLTDMSLEVQDAIYDFFLSLQAQWPDKLYKTRVD